MKKNLTRSALITSILSLLLCVSMLVGTTFAWFTDSVVSGSNVITSGNLDIVVQYTIDGINWADLDGANDLFQKDLWEPGHTEVVALRIKNNGSLALKYAAQMNILNQHIGTNKDGGDIELPEFLKVSAVAGATEADVASAFAAENSSVWDGITAEDFLSTNVLGAEVSMLPGAEHYLIVMVDMPETVDNEANHNGTDVPSIEFGVNVLATQYTEETDSFGDQYDQNAQYQ